MNKSYPFWKFFWLVFLALSLAFAWYSFYTTPNNVKWINDINSAEELGKNSDKNMLLFFTGKWCSPCRIMKREVFSDKEVEASINSLFIPVLIDIDQPENKEIVQYYKVGATPTMIIVNTQGEVLDYAVGKIDKQKFLDIIGAFKPDAKKCQINTKRMCTQTA